MKFSLEFLKQIIDIKLPVKEVAAKLTAAGLEVEEIKRAEDDWILELEVTTNRYDWLSVLGVAQEIGAISGKKIKLKYPKIKTTSKIKGKNIVIEDKKDCFYYLARQINGVTVKPSPPWLKKLILNSGLAAVSSVVDVTNYCMLKWGNPLHAFDFDKIEGDIHIRRAKEGEPFLGIDQKKRILNKENLVIADAKEVIALAGVMGAKNSQVTNETKNVFLEAAIFSPVTIRRSRRQAGLNTDSSYRFERKVSAFLLKYASQEAEDLISKLSGGNFIGWQESGTKREEKPKEVLIKISEMKKYLGADFTIKQVKKILEALNLEVKKLSADKIKVKPAPSRFDIEKAVDVYEEFARIYGYDKIKPKMPFLKKADQRELILRRKENFWKFKNKIRDFISLAGFSEIITYSLENEKEISLISEEKGVALENPLRSQENTLRPVLSLGLIKAVRHNLNRGKSNLRFFEIADTYKKDRKNIIEKPFLSLGASGDPESFFLLKGVMFEILNFCGVKNFELKEAKRKSFFNCLDVFLEGKLAGFLGKLDKEKQEIFSLKQELFLASLDLSLLAQKEKTKNFKPFSRFPQVWRDISLAIQKDKKFEDVKKIIEKESQYLSGLKIIDTYQGKDLPENYFAFTLRFFYQSRKKTLSSQEVDSYHNQIRKKLNKQEGIILR